MKLRLGPSPKLYYHFQQRFLCIEYMYCNLVYYLVVHDSRKWYTLGGLQEQICDVEIKCSQWKDI
jgi:hypothetical protein